MLSVVRAGGAVAAGDTARICVAAAVDATSVAAGEALLAFDEGRGVTFAMKNGAEPCRKDPSP